MSTVAVIGAGYVGLVTAASLAEVGHQVTVAEANPQKLASLIAGEVPFFEPGLAPLVKAQRDAGRLRFCANNRQSVEEAEFVFLCLPTPPFPDGSADLSAIETVAHEINRALCKDAVVITKSTVPLGTAEKLQIWLDRKDVAVCANPEFLREGAALSDVRNPDRIVIGSQSAQSAQRLTQLYKAWKHTSPNTQWVLTDTRSAELIKYATNSFLAMKLSFINAIDSLCVNAEADSKIVLDALAADKRISPAFMTPGPGFGGSCFPKDVRALLKTAAEYNVDFSLLAATTDMNNNRVQWVCTQIAQRCKSTLKGKTIAALGIAFKANTDDVRESPAVAVIRRLCELGATVKAYDPQASLPQIDGASQVSTLEDAIAAVDAAVILTEWEQFREIKNNWPQIANTPLIDMRSL